MKSIQILLIEDNDGDILLTKEALEDSKVINQINVVRDGNEAIMFLNKEENFSNATTPDLILLDVNLPKKNGHEVLHYIKKNENFKHIPVIMLTTSSSESDILKSYKNHVNCYITKPIEVSSFLNIVSTIESFWISIVSLPKKS